MNTDSSTKPGTSIVGHGLLGRAFAHFADRPDILIFASGVSNSNCEEEAEYIREKQLLLEHLDQCPDRLFVYFSSCIIYDESAASNRYVRHKKDMEALIALKAPSFLILRLPAVLGPTENPHTLVNHFTNAVRDGRPCRIWSGAL